MSLSRRSFVKVLGFGASSALTSSFVGARGREAWHMGFEEPPAPGSSELILSSNENPLGPGKVVLDAVRNGLGPSASKPGRYPGSYSNPMAEALAKKFGVKPENILVGCGSTQILVTVTQVYTSKDRPLVGSLPTYEECSGFAAVIGSGVKAVPLDSQYKIDLDRTLHAAKGGGMLFFCSPNNPVATLIHSNDTKEFIKQRECAGEYAKTNDNRTSRSKEC